MIRITIIISYFTLICVLGCLLAYPIYLATNADFERIVSRTILILAVLLFYPTCKWLNINSMASLGWVKTDALGHTSRSWILGFIMLIPISAVYLSCGFRLLESQPISILSIFSALISAVISGLLIGLIEESIFRGLLQSQLSKHTHYLTTIIIVSAIYSSVHFLQAPELLSDDKITWLSGFSLLASAFANFTNIGHFLDAWLALFLAGIFLSLIKIRSNNLLWCIGIHAGWVTHIKLFKEFTDRDNSAGCGTLASNYDNYVGELSAVWIIAVLVIWGAIHLRTKASH